MKNMKYQTKTNIKAKPNKFPLNSKLYSAANKSADEKEKRNHPKGYAKLKKIEAKEKKGDVLGHINKSGKIYVSKKVPKTLRKEVAEHDKDERKYLLKRKK